MAQRIQSLVYGLSIGKQVDIATANTGGFARWRKLNAELATLSYVTETDEDEIGKGNEFIEQVYPVNYDVVGHRVEKYGSAEFTAWAWAFALGHVTGSAPYVIKPIDPGTTLELPYFTIVQQLADGGSTSVDELLYGCAVESVETTFHYGPGRQSLRTQAEFVASGLHTYPSGAVVPATQSEKYMLGASATITISAGSSIVYTDSSTSNRILQGTLGWKNNCLLPLRFLPGDGLVSGAAVGKRIYIGKRVPTCQFTAFLTKDSDELAKLLAQTTGTATFNFQFDGSNYVNFTWEKVSIRSVARSVESGLVAVTVDIATQYDATNGVISISSANSLAGIAG